MLRYYTKRSQGEGFQKTTRPQEYTSWIHGDAVTHDELDQLVRRYDLSPNIVRDVFDENELPRIEYSRKNHLYVFLRAPRLSRRGEVYTRPLLLIARDGIFLSLGHNDVFQPETIIAHETDQPVNPAQLTLLAIAAIITEYERLIQRAAQAIFDVSHRLKKHEVTNQDFLHFVTIEDNLNEHATNIEGMLALVCRLHDSNHHLFSLDDKEMLDDLALHLRQLAVSVASQRQSLVSIRSAHSTIANNNLNHRVGLLTAITVLITIPNVFFGMYGMNVALPFEGEPWAYTVIVAFTVILLFLIYMIARRFRMF